MTVDRPALAKTPEHLSNQFQYLSSCQAGYDWWSLQPLTKMQAPTLDDDPWSTNEIDLFILETLKRKGLAPSPRADSRTLARRLYVDLVDPPAPAEVIDSFAKNPSPEAWEKMNRLRLA